MSEAESLGDLLGNFRSFVSPALLDEPGWLSVLAAAEQWPVTCGALPFVFEFHLRDPRPGTDLSITLAPRGENGRLDSPQGGGRESADRHLPPGTTARRDGHDVAW